MVLLILTDQFLRTILEVGELLLPDRLQPSRIHHTMRVQIALTKRNDVHAEVQRWLERAYLENY